MTFSLTLLKRRPVQPERTRTFDSENDNIKSVLVEICDILDGQGSIEFIVDGFGQERWPVDVAFDLPVVVEQVPKVIQSICLEKPCVIDFYEQGLERTVEVMPGVELVRLRCSSRTQWVPSPNEESVSTTMFLAMLRAFHTDFVSLAAQCAPSAIKQPWFQEWKRAAA